MPTAADDTLRVMPAPEFDGRPLQRGLIIDWYSGPVALLARFDALTGAAPIDLAIEAVAERFDPRGLDLRLAQAWELPAGAFDSIFADQGAAFCPMFFANPDADRYPTRFTENGSLQPGESLESRVTGFRADAALSRPDVPPLLLIYGTGDRILRGWRVVSGSKLTEPLVRELLLAVPFEPDAPPGST